LAQIQLRPVIAGAAVLPFLSDAIKARCSIMQTFEKFVRRVTFIQTKYYTPRADKTGFILNNYILLCEFRSLGFLSKAFLRSHQ